MGAVLFAVLLFFGGATVGALGERYYAQQVVHARPVADTMRKMYVNEMKSRLQLTPDQIGKLNIILDQTRSKFRAFREEHRSEFERISQDQTNSVRAILTAQQQPQFDKLVAEREKRRREHDSRD